MKRLFQILPVIFLLTVLYSCGRLQVDLPQLSVEGLQTEDLQSQLKLIIELGFDKKDKRPFLIIEGEKAAFSFENIAGLIYDKEDLVDIMMHREIKPVLKIAKNIPYEHVEYLLNCLRLMNYRKLFFAVDGGKGYLVKGFGLFLPPATTVFNLAFQERIPRRRVAPTELLAEEEVEEREDNNAPPPPPPPPPPMAFQWNSVFYNKPAKAIQVTIAGEQRVLIDGKKIQNEGGLTGFVNQRIEEVSSSVAENSKIGIYYWLDVKPNTTYNNFIKNYYSLIDVYKQRWDAMAVERYNRPYADLSWGEGRKIKDRLPLYILGYGQVEYQYLKDLQEKKMLDDFVKENYFEY